MDFDDFERDDYFMGDDEPRRKQNTSSGDGCSIAIFICFVIILLLIIG